MKRRGFTLIELMIVVAIIAIIAAITIPNMTRSRMAANEASAIGSIKTIFNAQIQFKAASTNLIDGVSQYADLTTLALADPPFIDDTLGAGNTSSKSRYEFIFVMGADPTAPTYTITAMPLNTRSGSRNFFIDDSGIITWLPESAGAPNSDSPVLQ